MSILIFQFIPPRFPLGNRKVAFYMCDSLCFVNKFICTIFLDSTYKQYRAILVFVWPTSLSMTISRSIHVAASGIIEFFYIAE